MEVTLRSAQLAVVDDFLPADAFDEVFRYADQAPYKGVHDSGWRKVWRIGDGVPLQGPTSWFQSPSNPELNAQSVEASPPGTYPTGSGIDVFIKAVADIVPAYEDIVGPGSSWKSLSFAPFVYPSGTALSLHADGYRYTGAYTYYVHRQWRIHWGAYLLVLPPESNGMTSSAFLDDRSENESVWSPGIATCVLPKPNRLVLIGPGIRHLITRVDPNAGGTPRVSIAGFFHRA